MALLTAEKYPTREELTEVLRRVRLEEARLRSAALASGRGLGTLAELQEAALLYTDAVSAYRDVEAAILRDQQVAIKPAIEGAP